MVPVPEALETYAGVDRLPSLARPPVAILTVGGSTTVEWEGVEAPEAERMARDLVMEGWEETTLPERSIPGMVIRIFRRGERQRVVIHNGSRLTLLDTRAE